MPNTGTIVIPRETLLRIMAEQEELLRTCLTAFHAIEVQIIPYPAEPRDRNILRQAQCLISRLEEAGYGNE